MSDIRCQVYRCRVLYVFLPASSMEGEGVGVKGVIGVGDAGPAPLGEKRPGNCELSVAGLVYWKSWRLDSIWIFMERQI